MVKHFLPTLLTVSLGSNAAPPEVLHMARLGPALVIGVNKDRGKIINPAVVEHALGMSDRAAITSE